MIDKTSAGVQRKMQKGLHLTRPPEPVAMGRMERTLERIFVGLTLAVAAAVAWAPIHCYDIMWQLAVGRHVATEGLPRVEAFSYLIAGQTWMAEYWLYEVALYGLYRLGGYSLLVAVRTILVVALYAVWLCALHRRYRPWLIGVQFLVTLIFLYHRLQMRPELLSFLFFSLSFVLYERFPSWRYVRIIAVVFVVQALWVNLHQSFMLGPILALFFAADAAVGWIAARQRPDEERGPHPAATTRYLVAATTGMGASFLNPYGWRFLVHALSIPISGEYFGLIYEWKPLFFFGEILFRPLWVVGFVFSVAILAACGRKGRILHWILLLFFAWQAYRAWRVVGYLGIVMIPINCASATVLLDRLASRSKRRRASPRTSPALAVAVVVTVGLLISIVSGLFYRTFDRWRRFGPGLRHDTYPETSARVLADLGVGGNLLTSIRLSGYLMWKVGNRYKVGIDGRCVIYPVDTFKQYMALTEGRGDVEAFATSHSIVACVLHLDNPGLAHQLLRDRERWALVAVGREDVAFVRRSAVDAALYGRFEIAPEALDPYLLSAEEAPSPLPRAYEYRVGVFLAAGRNDLALRQVAEIERTMEDRANALAWRGNLLRQMGRTDEAEKLFFQALEEDPHCFHALLELAAVFYNRREWSRAADYARRAAKSRKRDAAPLVILARSHREMGDFGIAADALERARRLQSENLSIWFELGRVRLDLKEPHKAVAAFERALALRPRENTIKEWLALAHEQAGNTAEAIRLLRPLVRDDPENLRIRQRLRRLERELKEER